MLNEIKSYFSIIQRAEHLIWFKSNLIWFKSKSFVQWTALVANYLRWCADQCDQCSPPPMPKKYTYQLNWEQNYTPMEIIVHVRDVVWRVSDNWSTMVVGKRWTLRQHVWRWWSQNQPFQNRLVGNFPDIGGYHCKKQVKIDKTSGKLVVAKPKIRKSANITNQKNPSPKAPTTCEVST